MSARNILFFTGSRADYGLLKPLIQKFHQDKNYKIDILATGSHLSEKFGKTINEIEQDAYGNIFKIDILGSDDSATGVCENMGQALAKFAKILEKQKPQLAFVLGDRYEALAFAIVCTNLGIPLAHLHGGEVTEGAVDEVFRHSITKAAWLHFTATDKAKSRVIAMGEEPSRVWNVGALGVENAQKESEVAKDQLEKDMGWKFLNKNIMVTFHPVTREENSSAQLVNLLAALDEQKDIGILITAPNADAEGGKLLSQIESWAQGKKNVHLVKSLGQKRYLSVLKLVDAVVGNSSSGIIEAPALQTPTLDIGSRQKGRECAGSVIRCESETKQIKTNLEKILNKTWNEKDFTSPYGRGDTSVQIKKIVDQWNWQKDLRKGFYEVVERHSH